MKAASLSKFAWLALMLGAMLLALLTWAAGRIDERFSAITSLASSQIRDEGQFKEAVLKARHGLESDYDRLTDLTGQLQKRAARLAELEDGNTPLGKEIARYQNIVAAEAAAVENFKYQNAIGRNSLHYIQHELLPLLRTLPHTAPGQEFQHDLTDYTYRVLQLALGGNVAESAQTAPLGESLMAASASLPTAQREGVQRLVRHGRIISRNLPLLLQTTTDIVNSGSRRALIRITALATEEIHRQEKTGRNYQLLLAGAAGLMLFALANMARLYMNGLKDTAQQRRYLQSLMDHAGVGVLVVTPDDQISFANPEAAALLGYGQDQLLGIRVHDSLHVQPDGSPLNRDDCQTTQQLKTTKKWIGEIEYRKRDGSLVPLQLHAVSLAGSAEQGAMLAMHDITELRKARAEIMAQQQHLEEQVAERTAELRAAEARYRAVVEIAPDGFLALSAGRRIQESNAAFQQLSGYGSTELKGMGLSDLDCGVTSEKALDIESEMARQGYVRFESRIRAKDGRTLPVDVAMALWREGGMEFTFVRDITERKALDAAREAARREAERLVKVKSEFLANMSHEIRTPLNGVLGMAQIGYWDSTGRRAHDTFARIIQSGKLLLGVINDILDFSKIEAGRMALEHVPVVLPQVLREAIQLQEELALARGLSLKLSMAPNLPETCLSDALRLGQVLSNLLSNAIKFTPKGSVEFYAGVEENQVLFSISDTGIGMTAEQVSRLFTPFEQADGSTTRKFGGTGLGLAITQRLVQLMGGQVSVRSQPGAGSVFEVRLPLLEPAPAGQAFALPPMPQPAGKERLVGLSILVAEDDEINRMVLEDMLGGEGARITLAENGRIAIEHVIHEGPEGFDVVLMDVQMPEMDGFDATRRIRQLVPHLPVIGQTAHALAEERERCLASGMVDHVAKPVDLDQLVAVILKHLA
jgi:PAS domain S-box-containing protein